MKRLSIKGDTYKHKDVLKSDGFRWNGTHCVWSKVFKDSKELVSYQNKYNALGFKIFIDDVDVDPDNERKYHVKESWIFNLESMHDKLWCISYDIRDGKVELPMTIAGTTINNEDDLWSLKDELYWLEDIAKSRKVTGKEYGRIKQIVEWRVQVRYNVCMASGMSERDAGRCMEDL